MIIRILNSVSLALSGSQEGISKEFLNKPKRITNAEAEELVYSGCPIYENINGEYRILV